MNLIDAKVTKVLKQPRLVNESGIDLWRVDIEYVDKCGKAIDYLTFPSEEEAKKVEEGYIFKH